MGVGVKIMLQLNALQINCISNPIKLYICHFSTFEFTQTFCVLPNEPRHEKTFFCICENKDADQLCGNHKADQCLCFRFTDSTIPLLSKSEITSL